MENASKALIMAGAILIAIMIISLGILVFSRMSSSAKSAANMDEQEISNFNSNVYYSNPDYIKCSYEAGMLLD